MSGMVSMALPSIQAPLFYFEEDDTPRKRLYGDAITVQVNRKGVVDVDTVKGCTAGMRARPGTGCYGECYANKIADRLGIDFATSVKRGFVDHRQHIDVCINQLIKTGAEWYRIGVMGDPCHEWDHTLNVIHALRHAKMVAVIITKHWTVLSDSNLSRLKDLSVVVNTSTSGLDTDAEFRHRVRQIERLRANGIPSVNRVITCEYSDTTPWARECAERQRILLTIKPMIDNPLRVSRDNPRVLSGEIKATYRPDSVGGGKLVSVNASDAYLGHCAPCPDQCAAGLATKPKEDSNMPQQQPMFGDDETDFEPVHLAPVTPIKARKPKAKASKASSLPIPGNVQFVYAPSVIGSGYEADVAKIALEDGIAHRAARKNMQIHSAVVVIVDGAFAGFMTFQNNHTVGEFCLLQSVIRPDVYSPELYRQMVAEVIARNTSGYPMLMTTNPKSAFETPAVFESLGFHTYLKMSGFEYMLSGDPAHERMKVLAHITMTNVWNSVKGDWLKLKKEWNTHIDIAGAKAAIPNPSFATREGCWQGESGFANVVTGRSHNGNASVLDPVACEVVARFFMPKGGGRIYNPFGGGVQFGFVAGASGYEYLASEIRQNQCDANNALCAAYPGVRWTQADSSTFDPDGEFDLVFTCPPYYRVERYLDYDGKSPEGEINSLPTYEEFRETLFAGYRKAIEHLKPNRFFVVMTGDSRDKRGAYHCHEAETEIFFKSNGLSVYNKIVYLEAEFTRLAQAKKTLHVRKFPKREQKIIVAYKGDIDAIKNEFASIGRL
jgi:hypothetical protein